MAFTTIKQIKDEFLYFLRNQDVFSISQRGVSTGTSIVSCVGTTQVLINSNVVKNIRQVLIGSTALIYGSGYTINPNFTIGTSDQCLITFTSAQTGTATVTYDYGSTDKIFPDYPQPTIKLSNLPRMGFDLLSGETKEMSIGAYGNWSEYLLSLNVYDDQQSVVDATISTVRQKVMQNKKNFYYITFLTPIAAGPIIVSPFGEQKIIQRNQDFAVKYIFEE